MRTWQTCYVTEAVVQPSWETPELVLLLVQQRDSEQITEPGLPFTFSGKKDVFLAHSKRQDYPFKKQKALREWAVSKKYFQIQKIHTYMSQVYFRFIIKNIISKFGRPLQTEIYHFWKMKVFTNLESHFWLLQLYFSPNFHSFPTWPFHILPLSLSSLFSFCFRMVSVFKPNGIFFLFYLNDILKYSLLYKFSRAEITV